RLFERLAPSLRELFAGAVDVERQHRHRRAIRLALPSMAPLRRPFERARDGARIGAGEHSAIEIERVARLRDMLRPAFRGHRTFTVHPTGQPITISAMTTIAGIDGCPAGWLCIFQ